MSRWGTYKDKKIGLLGKSDFKKKRADYMKNYRLKKNGEKCKEKKTLTEELCEAQGGNEPEECQEFLTMNETCEEDDLENCPEDSVYLPDVDETFLVFRHPFTCIISGPSRSGKTFWTKRLLKNRNEMIKPEVDKVIWCYGSAGSIKGLKHLFPDIEFHCGMPDEAWLEKQDRSVSKLLILDDLMHECNNGFVGKMFTRISHHENISCFLIVQNIFFKSKDMREAGLNTTYRVLFNNPSDRGQLSLISQRVMGKGYSWYIPAILEELKKIEPYAYVVLDMHPLTNNFMRIRTNIFPDDEENNVFIPSKAC